MLTDYFTHKLGIIHLIRLICLIILLIFAEIKISSCGTYLNEFFGFNHSSILFYYILIWISFAFEIYFLINRLFASSFIKAKKSTQILYLLLSLNYILASCLTLYAMIKSSNGHVITETDLSQTTVILPSNCNSFRLIGILFGFVISFFYFFALILIHYSKD
jgi:hypothetical protein